MDTTPADALPLPSPSGADASMVPTTGTGAEKGGSSTGGHESRRAQRTRATAERRAAAKAEVAARKHARKPTNRLVAAITAALADLARPDRPSPPTLDDEILALVASADERATNIVLRRWGFSQWPAPTLEALGAEHGITRERTRQIEALHLERLQEIRPALPPLPFATRAVELLASHGGAMPERTFQQALGAAGIPASDAAVRVLPRLGELGFVPPIGHLPNLRLFLMPLLVAPTYAAADTPPTSLVDAGSDTPHKAAAGTRPETQPDVVAAGVEAFEAALQRALTKCRRAMRRLGAIPFRVVDVAPLRPEEVIEIALDSRPWRAHSGYAVPTAVSLDAEEPTVAREVGAALAASGRLTFSDARLALRRVQPRPIKLPVNVLAEILRPHPAFVLRHGTMTLRTFADTADDPAAHAAAVAAERAARLRPAERAVVDAMEPREGFITLGEMHAVLAAAGYNSSWMMAVTQAPFFLKLASSVYGLLGHGVPTSAVLAARRGGHRQDGERGRGGHPYERVLVSREFDPDTGVYRLAYRVTPSTLRGALRLPNRVTRALDGLDGDWPVRGSGVVGEEGAGRALSVRAGTLWDVSGWLRAVDADVGDHIAVTLNPATRELTLARVPAEEAERAEEALAVQRAAQASQRTAEERARLRVLREKLRQERQVARQRRAEERHRLAEERRAAQRARSARLAQRQADQTSEADAWVEGGRWSYVDGRHLRLRSAPLTLDQVRLVYVDEFDPHYGDVVVGIYPDFPLAPGTRGVAMGVIVRLDAGRGKRRFVGGLIEMHLLDRGRPLTPEEADILVPDFARLLTDFRAALAWREYRPPQLDLLPRESA